MSAGGRERRRVEHRRHRKRVPAEGRDMRGWQAGQHSTLQRLLGPPPPSPSPSPPSFHRPRLNLLSRPSPSPGGDATLPPRVYPRRARPHVGAGIDSRIKVSETLTVSHRAQGAFNVRSRQNFMSGRRKRGKRSRKGRRRMAAGCPTRFFIAGLLRARTGKLWWPRACNGPARRHSLLRPDPPIHPPSSCTNF